MKYEHMDLTEAELLIATEFMSTLGNAPTGNIISAHKFGNAKVILRDTYMTDDNIPAVENTIARLYPNTQATITRI